MWLAFDRKCAISRESLAEIIFLTFILVQFGLCSVKASNEMFRNRQRVTLPRKLKKSCREQDSCFLEPGDFFKLIQLWPAGGLKG